MINSQYILLAKDRTSLKDMKAKQLFVTSSIALTKKNQINIDQVAIKQESKFQML